MNYFEVHFITWGKNTFTHLSSKKLTSVETEAFASAGNPLWFTVTFTPRYSLMAWPFSEMDLAAYLCPGVVTLTQDTVYNSSPSGWWGHRGLSCLLLYPCVGGGAPHVAKLWAGAVERWERWHTEGECAGLDVVLGSDSLQYFNGRRVECVAAGHSPRIGSSVTSSGPVWITKCTGATYTRKSPKLDPMLCCFKLLIHLFKF